MGGKHTIAKSMNTAQNVEPPEMCLNCGGQGFLEGGEKCCRCVPIFHLWNVAGNGMYSVHTPLSRQGWLQSILQLTSIRRCRIRAYSVMCLIMQLGQMGGVVLELNSKLEDCKAEENCGGREGALSLIMPHCSILKCQKKF